MLTRSFARLSLEKEDHYPSFPAYQPDTINLGSSNDVHLFHLYLDQSAPIRGAGTYHGTKCFMALHTLNKGTKKRERETQYKRTQRWVDLRTV